MYQDWINSRDFKYKQYLDIAIGKVNKSIEKLI